MSCLHSNRILTAVDTRIAQLSIDTRLVMDGGRLGGGLPERTLTLAEVRKFVLDTETSGDAKDAVWAHTIGRVRDGGEEWLLAAVWLMLPGLRKLASRMSAGCHAIARDIESEIVEGFLEALRTIAPDQCRPVRTLLGAARRRAERVRREYWDRQRREAPVEAAETAAVEDQVCRGDLLGGAIHRGVLSTSEADLISRTRIEGERLGAVAQRMGLPYGACRQRRARAEQRLGRYATRTSIRDGVPADA